MKNHIYNLINLFLLLLLFFLPFYSFAQSLAPIPEVGEGVCVSNCDLPSIPTFTPPPEEDIDTTFEDSPLPSPTPLQVIEDIKDNLQNVIDLDDQALEKLEEEDYPSVPPLINDAIESLNDSRNNLKTDPSLEELRTEEAKTVAKIDRSLKSSINSHKRASKAVEQIINNPQVNENESLLSRFLKKAKRYLLEGRRYTSRTSTAVAGVRG